MPRFGANHPFLLLAYSLFFIQLSLAETVPGSRLFDEHSVSVFSMSVAAEFLPAMASPSDTSSDGTGYDTQYAYVPAQIRVNGLTLTNIGLKFAGHGGTTHPEAWQFKIDFGRYETNFTMDGLKKVALHRTGGGSSRLAEYLGYGVFREFGISSPRTGWAEVSLNGTNVGLMTLVEEVDKDFLKRYFPYSRGALYKPEIPASFLSWRGTNVATYTNLNPQFNNGSNAALIHFLDVINHEPVTNFFRVLDVRGLLVYLAGNVAFANFDSLVHTVHNYLLLEFEPDRFTFLPWDLGGGAGTALPIFPGIAFFGGEQLTLPNTVLSDSRYKSEYIALLREMLHGPASTGRIRERINSAVAVLTNRLSDVDVAAATNVAWLDSLLAQIDQVHLEPLTPHIFINEIMAGNSSTITDEYGHFADWIELYNAEERAVDLRGYYLSDDPKNLRKWKFGDNALIAPKSYLLIWADEEKQGALHASFKLSSSGETVTLISSDQDGNATVDQLAFPPLAHDISYGRVPLNPCAFVKFFHPTPGIANDSADEDHDGMPDSWEIEHKLIVGENDADADPDGDGISNLDEFRAASDPQDAHSPCRLRVAPTGDDRLSLSWSEAAPARRFWFELSNDLRNWRTLKLTVTNAVVFSRGLENARFIRLRDAD